MSIAAKDLDRLEAEHRKNERAVSFTELLRSAHGLGKGEDEPPPAA